MFTNCLDKQEKLEAYSGTLAKIYDRVFFVRTALPNTFARVLYTVNFWYISQLFLVFLLLLWESKYYLGWNGLDLLLQFWIRLYVL